MDQEDCDSDINDCDQDLSKNDNFFGGKSITINSLDDSLQSENLLKINFNEDSEMKEIVVERLEDFMEDGSFPTLSIIDANPDDLQQYDSNPEYNILIAKPTTTDAAEKTMNAKSNNNFKIKNNSEQNSKILLEGTLVEVSIFLFCLIFM